MALATYPDDHPMKLERCDLHHTMPSLFGFAPGGVYHAASVARNAVGSYPTFSPLPHKLILAALGGFDPQSVIIN